MFTHLELLSFREKQKQKAGIYELSFHSVGTLLTASSSSSSSEQINMISPRA